MSVDATQELTRELVLERIREDSSFVLATHENPDGDALGSLVGIARPAHHARQGLGDVHRARRPAAPG